MMIESWPVFIGITLVFMGGCAFMAGQALASTWRSPWLSVPYGLMLAAAGRFLAFALFGGTLLAPGPFLVNAVTLVGIFATSHRLTQARRMVSQYPWKYRRSGLFGWAPVETQD